MQPHAWLCAVCASIATVTGLVVHLHFSVPPWKPGLAGGKPLSMDGSSGPSRKQDQRKCPRPQHSGKCRFSALDAATSVRSGLRAQHGAGRIVAPSGSRFVDSRISGRTVMSSSSVGSWNNPDQSERRAVRARSKPPTLMWPLPRYDQPSQEREQCRFACTVQPKQRTEPDGFHGEADIVERHARSPEMVSSPVMMHPRKH